MRSRISWLVAATTSAVVISFVVPLCLLVRVLAEDRAMAAADQEARNVAILVSTLDNEPQLPALVEATDERGFARTSLILEDDRVLGAADPGLLEDPAVKAARSGEASTVKDADGGRVVLPVVVADGTEVVVSQVTHAQLHDGVTRAWVSIVALGLVLFALALVVADRLGRRISRPLVGLAGTAHRLRTGSLDARAEVGGAPETMDLAEALNALAERITELLAAERAAVGDLSHRLRTPVTALRLDAESVTDPALATRLQDHIATLQRDIDAIVHDARRPVREDMTSACDASAVVAARTAFWRPLAEDQGRPMVHHIEPAPLWVPIAAADLRDIVDILIDNVFAHTAEGVAFSVVLRREGGQMRLDVEDEGAGVDPTARPGERRGSTGLGLDIVRRTVAPVGGAVHLGSRGGSGTRVEVTVPLHSGGD
jgi:signal transduction histidine kinase